jgi:hypothetical protein
MYAGFSDVHRLQKAMHLLFQRWQSALPPVFINLYQDLFRDVLAFVRFHINIFRLCVASKPAIAVMLTALPLVPAFRMTVTHYFVPPFSMNFCKSSSLKNIL